MSKSAKTASIIKLAQLSALVALLIVFGVTNLGYIKTGFAEITLNVIPVAIGAIVLGPSAGAVCGAAFGLTSFFQCFGMSAFGVELFQVSPVLAFIVCFVPRVLEGWLTGLIFKGLSKRFKSNSLPCGIASLCCPLLNTVLFVGLLLLLYGKSDYMTSLYTASAAKNLLMFIAWFVGLNGIVEAIAGFIISTAASKALLAANKRLR